jgi:hypothetical protein
MSDEHLIGKVRGAAPEGLPPSVANGRAAAVLGCRMRRRRHAAAILGSGLTVSGVVALLTLAGPGGQSVVQTPSPATEPSDAASWGNTASAAREWNLELLRDRLGADWVVRSFPAPPDGRLEPGDVEPRPGSDTNQGLPTGYQAKGVPEVYAHPSKTLMDCDHEDRTPQYPESCTIERTNKGQKVIVRQEHTLGRSTLVLASVEVSFLRPDGSAAHVSLSLESNDTTADLTLDREAQKWLANYKTDLIDTAIDNALEPDVPPGSTAVQPCSAWQIQMSIGPRVSEATGQNTVELLLRNESESACTLDGYPDVELLNAQGPALPFVHWHDGDQMLTGAAPTTVDLAPGATAYLGINKYRCDGGDKDTAVSIRVTLRGGTSAQTISLAASGRDIGWCGQGEPGSKVTVTPVEPTEQALWAARS